jgi:hypothetical protein
METIQRLPTGVDTLSLGEPLDIRELKSTVTALIRLQCVIFISSGSILAGDSSARELKTFVTCSCARPTHVPSSFRALLFHVLALLFYQPYAIQNR